MFYSTDPKPSDVGGLLTEPSDKSSITFDRTSCAYENHSEKYMLKSRNFQRQYAHLYAKRLWSMRDNVTKAAKSKWGKNVKIRKLHELQCDEKCVIIGTLFKHMELKPSILKEISEDHNLMPQPIRSNFVDESDKLILEDELQRILLVGELDVNTSVTGAIIAVYGKEPENARGKFHVEEYCFQELPTQIQRPVLKEDKYIAFISGLELGGKQDQTFPLQLFIDLVTGQVGDMGQQEASASIVRVVVAGNSLSVDTQDKESFNKAKYLTKKTTAGSVDAIKSLDDALVQLSACVDVDVMSGEFDPANYILPQQPLHRCMFPQASKYETFTTVTNPYDFSMDGVRILGTSGQPLHDIMKYSTLEDPVEIMEKCLKWGHIAPTAPDTLGCYPYFEDDPFILDICPHIFFSGNQAQFKCNTIKGPSGQQILEVSVPRFCDTATCVLVNLKSLECQPLQFMTDFNLIQSESPEVDK